MSLCDAVWQKHREDAEKIFRGLLKSQSLGTLEELGQIFSSPEKMVELSLQLQHEREGRK